MSDMFGRLMGIDPPTGLLSLPLWAGGAAAALLVFVCLMALTHAGREGAAGALARMALLLIGAGAALLAVEFAPQSSLTMERHLLAARAQDLLTRAAAPGSALACLDAIAGDTVESWCEKAVFQSPEATAAAVSYVTAQLALLADFSAQAQRPGGRVPMALATLRRAIETDRFGFVAHTLTVRDGCTPSACDAFALLEDSSRIAANVSKHTYDLYVARHAAAWPASGKAPVAAATMPPVPADVPTGSVERKGVFFPSAASIPPVSIMDTEPTNAPESSAPTAPPAKRQVPPPPPRRPAQSGAASGGSGQPQPARPPIDLNAASRSSSPAFAPQQ